MAQLTLGLGDHRPEMTPLIRDHMRRHEAVFLEEPPDPDFAKMLTGDLSVESYLSQLDMEYPAFSRNMCYVLRELKAAGKAIFQVEPFLGILLHIHELFAAGRHPGDLQKNSIQYPVYLVEKNATQALLAYYQAVMTGSFEDTVEAILKFARMDAARFALRDSLRARAIAPLARKYASSYIEAGGMHYPLWRQLRQQAFDKSQIKVVFLADNPLKSMGHHGHLYGPGDRLTLLYVFHPHIRNTRREKLLAARSIIYAKTVVKEELTENLNTFPHLRDELDCIRMTRQLTFDDCRQLFPMVRRANSCQALKIIGKYLTKRTPVPQLSGQPEQAGSVSSNDITTV